MVRTDTEIEKCMHKYACARECMLDIKESNFFNTLECDEMNERERDVDTSVLSMLYYTFITHYYYEF